MIRIPKNNYGIKPGLYIKDSIEAKNYRKKIKEKENINKTYLEKRLEEYGSAKEQLEFIVENGIDAFVEKQNKIKLKHPKE